MKFPEYTNKVEVKQVATSINQFSLDLYQTLIKNASGNLFFSPFSITTVLAMTYMGTKENTDEELMNALHFPKNKDNIKLGFCDLLNDYKQSHPEYELKTSNMIYISNLMSLLNEFHSAMTKDFLGDAKTVNFANSESVRKEINDKVEMDTNSRIKDLIPSGVLNALTVVVLVNAVYFKGFWEHKFDPNDTKDKKFWVTANQSKTTSMMFAKKNFKLASLDRFGLDARLLQMDFEGSRLSMSILLPNKRDGLAEMESKLSTVDFEKLRKSVSAHKQKVKVTIPKFKLEETLDLVDTLKQMGVHDLFDEEKANLSAISGSNDLYVSRVIHKAFLEVNEKGSEAAAATAVVIKMRCIVLEPVVIEPFVADHPFMFYIEDHGSGFMLFTGKFVQPS